jgi:hypothetical protein
MLAATSSKAEQWSTSAEGMKCVPLRRADTAKLWILYGEKQTAVEGSKESAAKRGDDHWNHLFFSVEFGSDRPIARCMRVRWRVEPWGSNPVDAADFGGSLPSGTMDLFDDSDHDEVGGAIQIWAPDDHVRERPETFRIVLLDPITGAPLAGTVGTYDPRTGMRARHPAVGSLNMKNRMVMTVLDAPEQQSRQ